MKVPFFRPSITEQEIEAVVACLRSGWLTTGPVTRDFEAEVARYVGAKHAIALNSCTAALHLALDAVGLQRGELVIVPTMTFAATAEVVRYFDAVPVFVDCDPVTQCIDPAAARATLERLRRGERVVGVADPRARVRAIIPMHYGGQMVDVDAINALAEEFDLAVIEDAAHTLPAYTRSHTGAPWRSVGTTAKITCFSFYANKCITTGEGGMAVTDDDALVERMRLMSLHGMSKDAWKRYTS
ncbi:MAG TPA: DegT/DnrJ/EryC1/StrS aminotransferase family protein, partial [Kofleriaceae bacterium]|nr:DegT/DnrJ/EryC1/StrS aminotransferase family protein [Kofleriaceae bacterium]